jgi:uncharacterized protein involved in exopolysaccharide biosynthesis
MSEKNNQPESLFNESVAGEIFSRYTFEKVRMGLSRRLWFVVLSAIVCAYGITYLPEANKGDFLAEATLLYQPYLQSSGGDDRISPKQLSLETVIASTTRGRILEELKSSLGLKMSNEGLRTMLEVSRQGSSDFITVAVRSNEPDLAVNIANKLSEIVVKSSQERYRVFAEEAYRYYSAEKNETLAELDQLESSISMLDCSSQGNKGNSAQSRAAIEQELLEVALKHKELEVEYASLETEFNKMPDQISTRSNVPSSLEEKLSEMELALVDARTRFGNENPKIEMLEDEIQELKSHLATEENSKKNMVLIPNQAKDSLRADLIQLSAKLGAAEEKKNSLTMMRNEFESC